MLSAYQKTFVKIKGSIHLTFNTYIHLHIYDIYTYIYTYIYIYIYIKCAFHNNMEILRA